MKNKNRLSKISYQLKFIPLIFFATVIACPNPTDINSQYPINYIRVKKDDGIENTIAKSSEVLYANVNSSLETPVLASSKSGNSILVWVDNSKGTKDVYARRLDSQGNPLGEAFQVNTTSTSDQNLPTVAINESGNFVIAWSSKAQDGDGYGVYARRYDRNGGYIGNEFKVNTSSNGDQWIPSVAMTSTGAFVIVWQSYGQDANGYGVVGQKFDKGGNPFGGEFLINNTARGSQEFPKIAMDTNGNFIVTWVSDQNRDLLNPDSAKFKDIYARKFNKDGSPSGNEFVVSSTIGEQGLPNVAISDNNNFVVAWNIKEQNSDNYDIYARTSLNGTLQKNGFRVDINNRPDQLSRPALAMDSTGNFMIAWNSAVGIIGSSGLYGKKYNNKAVEQGNEFKINSSGNNVLQPEISTNKSGNFFVTWREY